jgi:hypothetical protein
LCFSPPNQKLKKIVQGNAFTLEGLFVCAYTASAKKPKGHRQKMMNRREDNEVEEQMNVVHLLCCASHDSREQMYMRRIEKDMRRIEKDMRRKRETNKGGQKEKKRHQPFL